jgi:uncharacterized membrane protein
MSSVVNPYETPKSDVNEQGPADRASIEAAIAGRYDFEIEEVLKEAWRLNNGFKLTFWGALIVLGLATGIAMGVLSIPMASLGKVGKVVLQLTSNAVGFVVGIGIVMLAVRRAAELPVSIGDAFSYFGRWAAAIVAGILVSLITGIGFVLLVIPGVYFLVAYHMTMPLIGDRRLGAWEAMEISRQALSKKWFKIFLTGLVTIVLVGLSALLVVPLIWTFPWAALVTGVLYRRIFGVASTT